VSPIAEAAAELAWAVVLGESVSALAWSSDGTILYAGSADGMLTAYLAEGDWRFRISAHTEGLTSLCPQPGGERLATAGEDGRLRLWDGRTGEPLQTVAEDGRWIEHLSWSSDGGLLAAAAGGRVYLWGEDRPVQAWDGHPGAVGALAWSPRGRRLASAANKAVYLWDLQRWEPLRVLRFPGAAVSLAWSADGHALAAGTQDGFLQVRAQVPGQNPRQLSMSGYPGKVHALAWHPQRPRLATCGGSDVVLWDLDLRRGQRQALPLRRHGRGVTALAFAPDGQLLASADRGGRLCLWDSAGQSVHEMELGAEVTALAWEPTTRTLAVGNVDGVLRLFRFASTRPGQRRTA
jgi:WD40 repeat protein